MAEEKVLPSDEELKEESETEEEEGTDAAEEESEEESGDESESEEEGEETVTLKKSELDKIKGDRDNYRRVALAKKGKKGSRTTDKDTKGEFVSKSEFYRGNEKEAVKRATIPTDNDTPEQIALKKEIDENWESITKYFKGTSGKSTPEDIHEDILDAHAAWKRRNPPTEEDESDDVADIVAERGHGGSPPPPPQKKRKRVIKPQGGMDTWYGEPEEDK